MIKDKLTNFNNDFVGTAPRTKKHLAVYVLIVFGYKIPHLAPCHNSQLDALWGAYTCIDIFPIWYAMRGSGKTLLLAILSVIETLFKVDCGITVLGGSFEQSKRCVEYLESLWNKPLMPKKMLVGGCVQKAGYKLSNGSWVKALACSSKSVRGLHPQKLRLDEVDEMERAVYYAALGQPKRNKGILDNVLASSTLHHAFGLMSEIIDTANEIGAKLYQWCYKDLVKPYGFWDLEEIKNRRRQITIAMFEAEYELKRPMVGKSIFDFKLVENAYKRSIQIVPNKKNFNPIVAGIDWGYNVTAMSIVEEQKERFICFENHVWNAYELTERCRLISDILEEYNIKKVYTDFNPKDANFALKKILNEQYIYTQVIPVQFNIYKDVAINVIRYLLENNILDISSKELKSKLQKYHYKNERLEIINKVDDHEVDSLISWAARHFKLIVADHSKRKKLEMKLKLLPQNIANYTKN